ncbi:MAG: hypothetical protein ACUVTM_01925 [Candidatus Bathyarchaeia archaeon]
MPQVYRGYVSPDVNDGVMGDPTCASPESGERFFNAIVDKISQFILDYASGNFDRYILLKGQIKILDVCEV